VDALTKAVDLDLGQAFYDRQKGRIQILNVVMSFQCRHMRVDRDEKHDEQQYRNQADDLVPKRQAFDEIGHCVRLRFKLPPIMHGTKASRLVVGSSICRLGYRAGTI